MKGIEIFVVAMKGVPLEVVLRSLPKICRTGVVTSHRNPGKLRHQMLGNASKIRKIKMSSRAEERAASSANCPNPSLCLPNHKSHSLNLNSGRTKFSASPGYGEAQGMGKEARLIPYTDLLWRR